MRTHLIIVTAVAALIAGQAQAHARLLSATPRAGSTVAAPQALRLRYSEAITAGASHVALAGPGGAAVATGAITLGARDKRLVIVPIIAKLTPGAYKVTWTMHTPDDHNTDGAFAFTVKR